MVATRDTDTPKTRPTASSGSKRRDRAAEDQQEQRDDEGHRRHGDDELGVDERLLVVDHDGRLTGHAGAQPGVRERPADLHAHRPDGALHVTALGDPVELGDEHRDLVVGRDGLRRVEEDAPGDRPSAGVELLSQLADRGDIGVGEFGTVAPGNDQDAGHTGAGRQDALGQLGRAGRLGVAWQERGLVGVGDPAEARGGQDGSGSEQDPGGDDQPRQAGDETPDSGEHEVPSDSTG